MSGALLAHSLDMRPPRGDSAKAAKDWPPLGIASRSTHIGAILCQHLPSAVRRRRVGAGSYPAVHAGWCGFNEPTQNPWIPPLAGCPGCRCCSYRPIARKDPSGRPTTQAQDVQPRPRRFVIAKARPTPARRNDKPSEHEPGPQRRPRHPHRERSGNFKESELESLR